MGESGEGGRLDEVGESRVDAAELDGELGEVINFREGECDVASSDLDDSGRRRSVQSTGKSGFARRARRARSDTVQIGQLHDNVAAVRRLCARCVSSTDGRSSRADSWPGSHRVHSTCCVSPRWCSQVSCCLHSEITITTYRSQDTSFPTPPPSHRIWSILRAVLQPVSVQNSPRNSAAMSLQDTPSVSMTSTLTLTAAEVPTRL